MPRLELKVPPLAVAALVAAGMGLLAPSTAAVDAPVMGRWIVSLGLAVAGIAVSLSGVVAFRRAQTTVNPLSPQRASTLVTRGIYSHTRNPMYFGNVLVLCAWAAYLAAPWTLVGPIAFMLYIDRFQIRPEERALAALFGTEFTAYAARVRRWL